MADSTYKYGGNKSNEQRNTISGSTGFGETPSDPYFGDLSNEQKAMGKTFKGFKPNDKAVDFERGGDRSSNENPKGFKQ